MKVPTKMQGVRFRAAELEFAADLATQLGCATGDVIRVGIGRLKGSPPTPDEIESVRLPRGNAALSVAKKAEMNRKRNKTVRERQKNA